MFDLDISADFRGLTRRLDAFAQRQVPYGAALAVNDLAKQVQAAEVENLRTVFDNPTPFTLKSVGVRKATKATLTAVLYVRDVAAAYLLPYEVGGPHALGTKRGLLVPKNAPLNAYGNLPRNLLRSLKGRKDIYIGAITTAKGERIAGVWQRSTPPAAAGKRGRGKRSTLAPHHGGGLRLLIRFEDPLAVTHHLGYRTRAQQVVAANYRKAFGRGLARAIATAR